MSAATAGPATSPTASNAPQNIFFIETPNKKISP
jgi:hypothetical protein